MNARVEPERHRDDVVKYEDNVYDNISSESSEDDMDGYESDDVPFRGDDENIISSLWTFVSSFLTSKEESVDPLIRQYFQLKDKNEELLLTLRIVEPWTWDFFDVFVDMDDDGGGEIEIDEFLGFYHLERTAFSERIFNEFDQDESGGLDFAEFIAAVWNYCTSTSEDLLKYAFDMYDLDANGTLAPEECSSLLRMIFAKDELDDRLTSIIVEMDADGDGEIDFGELVDYAENHPYMIEPMVAMRTILRNSICGSRYWREATEWRVRQFGPHANMTRVIAFKRELHEDLRAFEAKHEAIVAAKREAKQNVAKRKRQWALTVLCRKVSGIDWLIWIRGHCEMIVLQRGAEEMSNEDNLAAAEMRQRWIGMEKKVTHAFKDVEKNWVQQKSRLLASHMTEKVEKVKTYHETKEWDKDVKKMIRELLELRRSQGAPKEDVPTPQIAREQIEMKLIKKAEREAVESSDEEFKVQVAHFEKDNAEMLETLRRLPIERLDELRNKRYDAWSRLVGEDVMRETPQNERGTMGYLDFREDSKTKEEMEHEALLGMLVDSGGFKGGNASAFAKNELRAVIKHEALHPFCPHCEHVSDSTSAKFCMKCGSYTYVRRWDENVDAVVYTCMATGASQLHSPASEGNGVTGM